MKLNKLQHSESQGAYEKLQAEPEKYKTYQRLPTATAATKYIQPILEEEPIAQKQTTNPLHPHESLDSTSQRLQINVKINNFQNQPPLKS